jgi:hypothetical protein
MKTGIFWTAAGSEAPRRFHIAKDIQIWCITQHPKAVSPLRFATALHSGL